MPSEEKIIKLSQARTLYNDLRGRIENVVTNQIATIDTSKADKVTGATNGNFAALDSNGNLIDSGHKHSDYLTEHQTIPVKNVRNTVGTSLVDKYGDAVIPRAHGTEEGMIHVPEGGALNAYYGVLSLITADSAQIKAGTEALKPIAPFRQHESTFFGLAKAAGDTTQAQIVGGTVGNYTDSAKTKIQNMLNVSSANAIASLEENNTANKNYSVGDLFVMDGKLYKVTAAIAQDGAIITEGNGQNCEEVSVASEFARSSDIPTVPVQDVQVNGTSILSNGVANVPLASDDTFGVAKVGSGLAVVNNAIVPNFIGDSNIKKGTVSSGVIASSKQHIATFYGLAKAAGDTTQASSSNSVGTYTDNAKTAIRNMIGAAAQSDIPSVPVQDVQVNGASILSNGIANVPVASSSAPGVVMVDQSYGIIIHPTLGYLAVNQATANDIKAGTVGQKPIVPYTQHASAFYGLAKAAGDSTQSASDNAVGTYTDSAKSAIRSMIGAASSNDIPSVPVQDVQVNGTSVLSNGVANVPLASHTSSSQTPGVVKVGYYTYGLYLAGGELRLNIGYESTIKSNGSGAFAPINMQHAMAFYGLARAAGDTTQAQSENAIGTYTNDAKSAIRTMIGAGTPLDVQINSSSIVSNNVANIPVANASNYGVIKVADYTWGVWMENGVLKINRANDSEIKAQSSNYVPITPAIQHTATFYGLAKAAGDTTQASSSNAVGNYTNEAKAAIKNMFGINTDVQEITVSGTTPTIYAVPNACYICGECTTLTIVPPSIGICKVRFTSGTSQTVLTASGVVWPDWFDVTALETNRIYEMIIEDGVYGTVVSWQS